MDEETIEKVAILIEKTSEKYELNLREVIIFGSRVTPNYREKSDIDILIVSEDFSDMAWNKRPGSFYEEWNYDELPDPEFICLTPEEFDRKKKRKPDIARTAVKKGKKMEI